LTILPPVTALAVGLFWGWLVTSMQAGRGFRS